MPAVFTTAPTAFAAVADYAVAVLRLPLILAVAVLFSLSFGVYLVDAMGAWPSACPQEEVERREHVKGNGFVARQRPFVPPSRAILGGYTQLAAPDWGCGAD